MFEDKADIGINIEKKVEGGFLVRLRGRVDSDTYSVLDEKIKPILVPTTKLIILDMEKVNYVSSAGLAVIFQIKKFIEEKNGSLVIASLQPQVKKVIDIVKALPKENIFENREELDKYLDYIQKKTPKG
ncbi:MAG: STAS domain-containing protein [Candidatus Omnitrophica bacterium]|nr:STAS domain-containing protein [Candidatus Omnitrophota bacterium]